LLVDTKVDTVYNQKVDDTVYNQKVEILALKADLQNRQIFTVLSISFPVP